MSLEAHGFFHMQQAKPCKINRQQFMAYEKVRQSGATNMFDIQAVCDLSRILKPEHVHNIIRHYSFLRDKYLPSPSKNGTPVH